MASALDKSNHALRFQVLAQIPEETFDRIPSKPYVLPDTPCQFQATTSNINPSKIPVKANLSKSATRRQQRKNDAAIIQNRPEASTSNNPFQHTDLIHAPSTSHKNDVHGTSHANPSLTPRHFPHATSTSHITNPISTTLDPTKHTVVFCSPQPNTPVGENNDKNV
ncbi:hypothetical protein WN944_015214 [Citrus x changshan-huyou]|uniref:Uncharacterized protein n=1 Tax=Citrus x changshan-huyou TaxID=2935761 RepID=A0AAP0M781_9ROSI